MIDYHIHPSYSIDAKGTLDEFCEAALNRRLQAIAFTTHLDTDPKGDDFYVIIDGIKKDIRQGEWLEHYEHSIRVIGDKYNEKGLRVLLGVEVDIYPEVLENLPEQFFNTDFDLVIGSVHLIDHLAISIREHADVIFKKHTLEEMGELYYSKLIDATSMSFVNVLGHIDIYRRFGEDIYGGEVNDLWREYIDELGRKMIKNNVGFEINTSSWRKGQNEPMPSKKIIKALIDRGIKTITIGSDAHCPRDVGYRLTDAYNILKEYGINEPARF